MKHPVNTAFASMLRKVGLSVTPDRLAILHILAKAKKPLSTQDILDKTGSLCDQATVYRCMKALKDTGIITQIDLRQNHAQYEFTNTKHHHHLVCTTCGRIEDIEDEQLEHILEAVQQKARHFATVTQHSLEFFGTCKRCIK